MFGSDTIHRIGRKAVLCCRKDAYRSIYRTLPAMFILWAALLTPVEAVTPQRDYWPTENWRISTPEAQGMDSAKILKVIPFIVNNLPDIQSLLVVRNGYLVFENYYGPGMPDRQDTVHSVTKSVTSALIGIARRQKLLTDLNQTLPDFFPAHFDDRTDPAKRKNRADHKFLFEPFSTFRPQPIFPGRILSADDRRDQ